MKATEELLRETLRRHVKDAPPILDYQPAKRRHRMSRAKWVAPLAVAAVTAGVVVGIAWFDRQASTGDLTPAAVEDDTATSVPEIRGLTGEAVGLALGLQPMKTADQPGCQAFAEFVNGEGFCFEQLTWPNRPASYILGEQISGDAPTEIEADYLDAVLELDAMTDGSIDYDAAREAELKELIAVLEPDVADLGEAGSP
jgi:hypothetical protein